jgi:hypothetical protein
MEDLQSSWIPDTVNRMAAFACQGEDAPGSEDPEVLGDVRLFQVQFLADVGHAAVFLVEEFEDPDPGGMGEGFEIFSVNGFILVHGRSPGKASGTGFNSLFKSRFSSY